MEINNSVSQEKSKYPEHEFLLSCFRIGIHINDLERLTYIDVIKIFLSFSNNSETSRKENVRVGTQSDINRYLK